MVKRMITLRCINCGAEFKQEVSVKDDAKLEKEIRWYQKNQNHCPKCRLKRMSKGAIHQ